MTKLKVMIPLSTRAGVIKFAPVIQLMQQAPQDCICQVFIGCLIYAGTSVKAT